MILAILTKFWYEDQSDSAVDWTRSLRTFHSAYCRVGRVLLVLVVIVPVYVLDDLKREEV